MTKARMACWPHLGSDAMTINVNKRSVFACIVLVGVGMSGLVAKAAEPTQTLQQALQERISDNMTMPVMMGGQELQGGIARVVFVVGADGRTHDVKIAKRSGSGIVDQAAVRLISSFKGLPASIDSKPIYAVLQYRTSGQEGDVAPKQALASQVALTRTDAAAAALLASQVPAAKPMFATAAPALIALANPIVLHH